MPLRRNLVFAFVTCLTCATLPACQPDASTETPEASSGQEQAQPLEIVEIIAGPTSDAATFRPMTPGDPIEVVLRTTGSTEGADLLIKVLALADGSTVGSETIRLDASSEAEQSIRFQSETPWEPGRYLIEITLDGELAGHQELEIHPEEDTSDAPTGT